MNMTELLDGAEYGLFHGAGLYRGAPPKEPLIEQILYEKDVICISSKAGVGKSVLAKQLMCALTSGTPFLETFNVPHAVNVLYIQTEGDRSETLERINSMKKGVSIDDSRWMHLNLPGASFNEDSEVDQLIALIKSAYMVIDVIIIDPLYTTIKGSLNDSEVVTNWIRNIRRLKGVFNCALIILNHENKELYSDGAVVERAAGSIFGSTFWAAFFNSNYKLKAFDGHHILQIGKNRSGKAIDSIAMKMVSDSALMYIPHDPNITENGFRIMTFLKTSGKVTAKTIMEATGVKRATTFRILRKLIDKEDIKKLTTMEGEFYVAKD